MSAMSKRKSPGKKTGKKRGPYKKRAKLPRVRETYVFEVENCFTPTDTAKSQECTINRMKADLAGLELATLPEVIGIVPTTTEEEAAKRMRENTENAWRTAGASNEAISDVTIDARVNEAVAQRLGTLTEGLKAEIRLLQSRLANRESENSARTELLREICKALDTDTTKIFARIEELKSENASTVVINNHASPADLDEFEFPKMTEEALATYEAPERTRSWWKFWTW